MCVFFAQPMLLATVVPPLLSFAGAFNLAAGHTAFGDLFLRHPATGEYAIFLASTLELVETGEHNESGFREQILANDEVARTMLRAADVSMLKKRLGAIEECMALFPSPLSALGGSGALNTYVKGGLWEHLTILAQSVQS